MIFVILGTQKFQFNRLLKMIDELIEQGAITDEVFAQTGYSTYQPKHYSCKDFLSEVDFREKIAASDFVISHGGIGSMMASLSVKKRVIVVPRNVSQGEHIDNHQYQLASRFRRQGYILMADNQKQLAEACKKVENFVPVPYSPKKNYIMETVDDYLCGKEMPTRARVIMIGSDLSVKGGIVSVIKNYLKFENWIFSRIVFIPTHIEASTGKKLLFFVKSLGKIKKTIKQRRVQIVHIHVSERGSFLRKAMVLRIAKNRGCKVILHHHGAEFEQYYTQAGKAHQSFIKKTLEMADLNIVLSQQLAPIIQNITPQARIQVLYNSVQVDPINHYNPKGREILMLGRLEQRKGTFELLETIQQIDDRLPKDIVFNLCGDGNLEKVREAVAELGIGHRINHIGWINSDDKDEMWDKIMCHILFSYNEGLPMAILETMGHGIPNISTNIASVPEVVINDQTGILLEPGDKEALGAAILRMAEDEAGRVRMSENAHRLIYEKFALKNNVRTLENIYEEMMEA